MRTAVSGSLLYTLWRPTAASSSAAAPMDEWSAVRRAAEETEQLGSKFSGVNLIRLLRGFLVHCGRLAV